MANPASVRRVKGAWIVPAVVSVCAVYLVALAMRLLLSESAWAANVAIPLLLIVAGPLLLFILVFRRLRLTAVFVLPPIAAGVVLSIHVANPAYPSLCVPLGCAASALDLAVGVLEARRVIRVYRFSKESSDAPADWFESVISELLGGRGGVFSRLAGLECSIWWYLIRSWGKKPFVRESTEPFSCHRESGYTVMVAVVLALCAVEAVAIHLALSRISVPLAVAASLLTVYAMLWIAGDARAVVLNPILVGNGEVTVRWGMYFSEDVPIGIIAACGARETSAPKSERVNLVPLGGDPFWIELDEPLPVRTFTGKMRPVRALAVSPDDRASLAAALHCDT